MKDPKMHDTNFENVQMTFSKNLLKTLNDGATIYLIFDRDDGTFLAATNSKDDVTDLASAVNDLGDFPNLSVCRMQATELIRVEVDEDKKDSLAEFLKILKSPIQREN
jgi:hypothetical protein